MTLPDLSIKIAIVITGLGIGGSLGYALGYLWVGWK